MTGMSCVPATLITFAIVLASIAEAIAAGAHTPAAGPLLKAALRLEPVTIPQAARRRLSRQVEQEADDSRIGGGTPAEALSRLDSWFFGPGGFIALSDAAAPEGASVAAALRVRKGTCVSLAIIYIEVACRIGLDARAVSTPDHIFVRVHLLSGPRNVELTEAGVELPDDIYRRRYRIHPDSIAAGVFLRDLTDRELLAHLLVNQGVGLSRAGHTKQALESYTRALKDAPQLQAAWYNRGLDEMNLDRLEDALASFSRAIALHPNDAQAHNNRGLTKAKLRDLAGARTDFTRALQLDPTLMEAEGNLRRLDASLTPR